MSRYDRYTTTELFNIFHDDYKDCIKPHWAEKFRELSGVTRKQTDACYFRGIKIPNDKKANKKLADFLDELDYMLCCAEDNYQRDNET